ncbi:MAG: phosphatase domain-containing protein [Flavobacteriaceae bacterium]
MRELEMLGLRNEPFAIFEAMGIFGKIDKLQIIAFQSYGTASHFYARGRALEDNRIDLREKGFFNLLWNTYKRFETDEIRNTPILIKLSDGRTFTGVTDNRGYYLIDETSQGLEVLVNTEGWLQYEISYTEASLKREILHQNRFPGELLIPNSAAKFGVISDIDDTILNTGVVSSLKWRVVINTVFKRAGKRTPLKGAAEFYHLLHRGTSGDEANPIYYVSHSPWNLYRYLTFFLETNNFPKGPILLRNFPDPRKPVADPSIPQKQKEIINILKTYPELNFILIGDSGERDPDIYIEIAQNYPNRIAAIYLRTVMHKKKMQRVIGMVNAFKTTPILVVEHSDQAIAHAKKMGFI